MTQHHRRSSRTPVQRSVNRRNAHRVWQFWILCILSFCLTVGWGQQAGFAYSAAPIDTAIDTTEVTPERQDIWSSHSPDSQSMAQGLSPAQQVQQGVEDYQQANYSRAIAHWQSALDLYQQSNQWSESAIVLENLARAYQQVGQLEQSITYWQQAADIYRQLDQIAQVGRMVTEQAQVYTRMGQYRQAITLLCNAPTELTCTPDSAIGLVTEQGDRPTQAAALGSLGEAHRLRGDYDRAIQYLEQTLDLGRAMDRPTIVIAALNGLGNTALSQAQISYRRANSAAQIGDTETALDLQRRGLANDAEALQYFQEGLALAKQQSDHLNQMRLSLSLIPPAARTGDSQLASQTLQKAQTLLSRLPVSQDRAIAAINLVYVLEPIPPIDPADLEMPETDPLRCLSPEVEADAIALLQTAVESAQSIGDRRSESFALGELGHIYECRQDYRQALELTRQARWAAEQDLRAKDSLYLWEWQTGRILRIQDQEAEAIAAYERAITTLEDIRTDLLIANRDLQFDFRDTIDPLYRQLVTLRLEREPTQPGQATPVSEENVTTVLTQLDSLRVAELQNYFGDECVILAAETPVDLVGAASNTAVLSSIILRDRTAIIVSFPNGTQQMAWIDRSSDDLRTTVNQYRIQLERFFDDFDPRQAQTLYQWMIAPFAAELEAEDIKTLVFIHDGILRSVPMAALYDGDRQQFLIEQYAVATTPSLTLTDPQPLNRRRLRALALGLTEEAVVEGRQFPALANVSQELAAIQAQLPGSRPLLNQDFTRDRLQQELKQTDYPIIHIATHGEFGVQPQDTFLVTGDSQKLTLTDLDRLLRDAERQDPIELLLLTACQTATGDDRSALGLAGVALQAGARSAIASLWFIDDAATAQIASQFYANLQNDPTLNKAEALQAAQLKVIDSDSFTTHPAYWAPFVLIGNWL